MRVRWQNEWIHWLVIAGMFAVAAIVWPQAPDRIPVHWNLNWEVDRYGGKFEGLLGLPITAAGIYLLLLLAPRIDPGRANYQGFAGAYATLRLTVTIMMALIYGIAILWAQGYPVDMPLVLPLAIGGVMIVLGNLMGKIRPNWFAGIRTPWTLSSRLSWNKTHRLGGWILIGMGALLILSGIARSSWAFGVAGAGMVIGLVWMVVYSYLVWRSDPDKTPPAGTQPE